jgi:major membrane immunogen (membrane-anchored lipoprotein)
MRVALFIALLLVGCGKSDEQAPSEFTSCVAHYQRAEHTSDTTRATKYCNCMLDSYRWDGQQKVGSSAACYAESLQ